MGHLEHLGAVNLGASNVHAPGVMELNPRVPVGVVGPWNHLGVGVPEDGLTPVVEIHPPRLIGITVYPEFWLLRNFCEKPWTLDNFRGVFL